MVIQEKEIHMSFTEAFNATTDPTIASVSIAIPQIGEAFYTASYGGDKLGHSTLNASTNPAPNLRF